MVLLLLLVSFIGISSATTLTQCRWCSSKRVPSEVESKAKDIYIIKVTQEGTRKPSRSGGGYSRVYKFPGQIESISQEKPAKSDVKFKEMHTVETIAMTNVNSLTQCLEWNLAPGRYRISGWTKGGIFFADPCGILQKMPSWTIARKRGVSPRVKKGDVVEHRALEPYLKPIEPTVTRLSEVRRAFTKKIELGTTLALKSPPAAVRYNIPAFLEFGKALMDVDAVSRAAWKAVGGFEKKIDDAGFKSLVANPGNLHPIAQSFLRRLNPPLSRGLTLLERVVKFEKLDKKSEALSNGMVLKAEPSTKLYLNTELLLYFGSGGNQDLRYMGMVLIPWWKAVMGTPASRSELNIFSQGFFRSTFLKEVSLALVDLARDLEPNLRTMIQSNINEAWKTRPGFKKALKKMPTIPKVKKSTKKRFGFL